MRRRLSRLLGEFLRTSFVESELMPFFRYRRKRGMQSKPVVLAPDSDAVDPHIPTPRKSRRFEKEVAPVKEDSPFSFTFGVEDDGDFAMGEASDESEEGDPIDVFEKRLARMSKGERKNFTSLIQSQIGMEVDGEAQEDEMDVDVVVKSPQVEVCWVALSPACGGHTSDLFPPDFLDRRQAATHGSRLRHPLSLPPTRRREAVSRPPQTHLPSLPPPEEVQGALVRREFRPQVSRPRRLSSFSARQGHRHRRCRPRRRPARGLGRTSPHFSVFHSPSTRR